jgi:ornithine cyclodeaminase/alanine dehydrogenase-like protein (mu-crystallin family)
MALILSGNDLTALFKEAASMDSLLESIEEALHAAGRSTGSTLAGLQLAVGDGQRSLRVSAASASDRAAALRFYTLGGAKDANFNLLFDGRSGDLLALVAGSELNVWRTGAPAGIACRYLARPEAKVLGVIGSGRQARGQLTAIRRAVASLEKVRVFSPTEEHRARFAQQMAPWLNIEVEPAKSARAAVAGADIVDVATSSRSPVLDTDWISPGALVISITSGQLPAELVARARFFVSWKQELLQGMPPREPYRSMISAGSWSASKIVGELGEVILGKLRARRDESDVVLFELLGMPVWDTAATAWAYGWAIGHKAGTAFSLA